MRKLDDKGNVAIILCLAITALLGFSAYVIDIGLVYAEKVKLTNAIDSAALAAVLELPNSDSNAIAVASDYLQKNNIDINQAAITISPDHKSIQISAAKNVKHLFAEIIGINSSNVEGKTKAVIGPVKSVKGGIRPFGIVQYDFAYGDLVTLKQGAGDGSNGNYGAVALGGQGANVFETNALYGYSGTVSVGDYINTEPGNIASVANDIKNYIASEQSTFDNFPRDSIRLWTIPLVNTLAVNGEKQVMVVGFAEFYVEAVGQNSGNIQITGRFVKYVLNGPIDTSLNETGAYGAKLSK